MLWQCNELLHGLEVRLPLEEVPNFIEDPAGYVAWRHTLALAIYFYIAKELAMQSWLEGRRLTFRKMILEPR